MKLSRGSFIVIYDSPAHPVGQRGALYLTRVRTQAHSGIERYAPPTPPKQCLFHNDRLQRLLLEIIVDRQHFFGPAVFRDLDECHLDFVSGDGDDHEVVVVALAID